MTDEPNPLSRWSQRKLAARRGDAVDEPMPSTPAEADLEAAPTTDNPVGTEIAVVEEEEATLPSVDELDAHSDYTVFMKKNVSEAIRRAALRKLWASDPVLANLDGLNHYDEDYNVVDQAITLAQTSYRPGLGYFDEMQAKLDEVEAQVDKVEGVIDRVGDRLESPADTESSKQQDGVPNGVSNSDAPARLPPDAARQVASVESDEAEADPMEKTGE